MTGSIDVICIGKACFDLSLQVSEIQSNTEKLIATDRVLCPGGPALNAATTIRRLGAKAAFVGKVGADYFGDEIIKSLNQEGVDTTFLWRGNVDTSIALIFSESNGKRLLANHTYPSTHKPPFAASDILNARAKVLLVDGHEPELTLEVLSDEKVKTVTTIFDAGSIRPASHEILSKVDVLIASEQFVRAYTEGGSPEKSLEKLSTIVPTVIITLGAKGLIWQKGTERAKLPAFNVVMKDSTGAGDAFHGAFAVSILEEMPWDDALRFASAAGALAGSSLGGFTSLPARSEVTQFLSMQEL